MNVALNEYESKHLLNMAFSIDYCKKLEVTGATKGLHRGNSGCGSSGPLVEHSLLWLLWAGLVH